MSTSTATANEVPAISQSFWTAKLGSLFGMLPLGVWTVAHLWNNLSAYQGAAAWEKSVTHYPHPFAQAFTLILVLVPLAVHLVWGLARVASSRPNNLKYQTFGNFKYIMQRITALGVLVALGAHIWLAMIYPRLIEGHAETFADISAHMRHHPPTLVVYLLLTMGVAYHLANGVWSFCMGWGLVSSKGMLRRFDVVTVTLFVLLTLMGWGAIYALYQAGAAFPVPIDT